MSDTNPSIPPLLLLALIGASKGALEHLTTTPPGGPHRFRGLALAALGGAILAVSTAAG